MQSGIMVEIVEPGSSPSRETDLSSQLSCRFLIDHNFNQDVSL